MKIEAYIEKIFFTKDDWSSILITGVSSTTLTTAGFPASKKSVTAAGNISNPIIGTRVKLVGDWKNDKKYGLQFDVEYCELDDTDTATVLLYLSSGFIKGCAEKTARLLVDTFKEKTLDIISNDPGRLTEINGIGEKKAQMIHESHKKSQCYLKIMKLFKGEITYNKAQKLHERYGDDAENVIKTNPYQLIYDLRGFGFLTVDKLAISSGISYNDPRRIKAGIVYSLECASQNKGHCYVYIDELASNVKSLIKNITVEDKVIVEQVVDLQKDKYLYCEDDDESVRIYLKSLYDCELNLANKISEMKRNVESAKYDKDIIDSIILQTETQNNIELELMQKNAIKTSLKNHISIITGGPGTGKTTIVKTIVSAARTMNMPIVLLAPTGRAARRLAESTGHSALTICKFNCTNYKCVYDKTLFVIDEASMIDIESASDLFYHIDKSCTVVLVGDIDQLPSIGAGNFFRDLVQSRIVPITKLRFTHRFSGAIAQNANLINQGCCKLIEGSDFEIMHESDSLKRQELILNEYYKALADAKGDYKKVQIIVPMRKRGDTCANRLNEIIREKVNPRISGTVTFKIGNVAEFRIGDRVMQKKNNPKLGVSNGDCGIVTDINVVDKIMEVKMDAAQKNILRQTRRS